MDTVQLGGVEQYLHCLQTLPLCKELLLGSTSLPLQTLWGNSFELASVPHISTASLLAPGSLNIHNTLKEDKVCF